MDHNNKSCKWDPIKNELRLNYTSIFSIFNIVNILSFCILAWWWSVWPKQVPKLINKCYSIISCVRLYNYKFVFIYMYLNKTGWPLPKKIVFLFFFEGTQWQWHDRCVERFVGETRGKETTWRPRYRREDNVKTHLQLVWCGVVGWIYLP